MVQKGVPASLRIDCRGRAPAYPTGDVEMGGDVVDPSASLADCSGSFAATLSSATAPLEFGFTAAHTTFLACCGSFTGSMNPDCVVKSVRIRHRITSASFLTAIDATPANMASRIRPRHTI